jgi:hypothetical protein
MKNRYGMDGMTYNVKADTSTGHFEVSEHIEIDDEDTSPSHQVVNQVDYMDRKELRNKFFELNQV